MVKTEDAANTKFGCQANSRLIRLKEIFPFLSKLVSSVKAPATSCNQALNKSETGHILRVLEYQERLRAGLKVLKFGLFQEVELSFCECVHRTYLQSSTCVRTIVRGADWLPKEGIFLAWSMTAVWELSHYRKVFFVLVVFVHDFLSFVCVPVFVPFSFAVWFLFKAPLKNCVMSKNNSDNLNCKCKCNHGKSDSDSDGSKKKI